MDYPTNQELENQIAELQKQNKNLLKLNSLEIIKAKNETENLLKNTEKLTKIGGWRWDKKLESVFWTTGTYKIHEIDTPKIKIGSLELLERAVKCYDEKDRPIIREAFNKCLDKGIAYDLEFPFTTEKGKKICIRTTAQAEHENGKVIGVIGNIIDITDQKKAENSLKESEERFKQLVKNSFDMVILMDSKGVQHYISESCEKMLGYKQEELIGIPVIEKMIHPDDQESTLKDFLDIVENKTHGGTQYRHRHKNGSWVYLEAFGTNQLDNPVIKSVVLNVRDITERKKAKEKLESNYSLLRMAGKTAEFGGWSYDVADKKIFWSDEIAVIREEPLGFSLDLNSGIAAYAPEYRNRISKVFNDCLELGIPYDEEMIVATAKGNNIWIRTTGEAVRDDNGNIVKLQGAFQNINSKKLREEALIESETQLIELNATKDKLFSIIAHDLRSPFNTILGYSDLLSNSAKTYDTERIVKFSTDINSAAVNTLALLDNLLNWAKSQTGQITFKPVKLNLQPIIAQTIEVLNSTAKIKNISLNYIQSDSIEVYADQDMLNVILRNLIANALKFTNSRGAIAVNAMQKNNFIEITVSDNGVGMNEETLNKLFKIDTTITTNGTANEKGSGLGLILCKEFVEKQGGTIWVESEPNKGATFHFTLPNDIVENINKNSNTNLETDAKKTPIILVVEDDEINYLYVEAILENGFKLVHAVNGKEGVELFNGNDIDLILMDINMPIMNGIEATKEIRKTNKEIPIIVLTAYVTSEDKEKALKAGCSDFLSKPLKRNQLLEIINNHLKATLTV